MGTAKAPTPAKGLKGLLTPWMGADPQFNRIAPPRDWERMWTRAQDWQHRGGLMALTPPNRPVPRQASCHFYGRDADPRNVYFY